MTRAALTLLVPLLVLLPPVAPLRAQPQVIEFGRTIRITTDTGASRRVLSGTAVVVTRDSVILRTEADTLVKRAAVDVARLEVQQRRPRAIRRGAMYGALVGGVIGAVIGAAGEGRCSPPADCLSTGNAGTDALIGAGLWGALGALTGTFVGAVSRHEWRDTTMVLRRTTDGAGR